MNNRSYFINDTAYEIFKNVKFIPFIKIASTNQSIPYFFLSILVYSRRNVVLARNAAHNQEMISTRRMYTFHVKYLKSER